MSKNLHKLYYKDYFAEVDWNKKDIDKTIAEKNKELTKRVDIQEYKNNDTGKTLDLDIKPLLLEVLYPGLATGIGINHEAGIKGEFQLGLHFNWTTGMPIIYGSSVKGVLKAYFEDFFEQFFEQFKDDKKRKKMDENNSATAKDVKNDIFEGKGKSIYDRDIFFDAVIVKTDKKGRILCSDSITPHGDNPLHNPTPITFMKIAPGCQIEFRFKLVDTIIGDFKLTASKKLSIFEKILTTVGIGAKTNVGYGQLKSVKYQLIWQKH